MEPLEELIRCLEKHGIYFERDADTLNIPAPRPQGFDIRIVAQATEWTLYFGAWRSAVTEEVELVNWALFGLSDFARLEVESRDGSDVRWTIQYKENGQWCDWATMRRTNLLFWKARQIRYLQNGLSGVLPEIGCWNESKEEKDCITGDAGDGAELC